MRSGAGGIKRGNNSPWWRTGTHLRTCACTHAFNDGLYMTPLKYPVSFPVVAPSTPSCPALPSCPGLSWLTLHLCLLFTILIFATSFSVV